MKNKIISALVCILILIGIIPISACVANVDTRSNDIVILFENDVHCAVDGYTKISAMKKEINQTHKHVGVVSSGDYIQGSSLGVVSQGEYIVKLMNLVGYDAITLGNHEFDYHLERLETLIGMMNTKPVCCNFSEIDKAKPYFEPYSMVSYGNVDIAYIGITTPYTITSSSPTQFRDENGEYLYTFNPSTLYDIVQDNIDSAKNAGAEYVVALSHIGYADDAIYGDLEDVETLIKNTDGLDVVLDGHSHSVIEEKLIIDEGGNEVVLSSTGTKFEYIGKLVISNGDFDTSLIKTEDYIKTDKDVDNYLEQIELEYGELGNRIVAYSEVDLITHDADGNRLVRKAETNLGDLCAEAIRSSVGADIGYVNGGGIRSNITAGNIKFNDLLNVFPFNNTVVLAQVSGQTIKDMLEMAMMKWPSEDGCFPHLAGVSFSFNKSITSSVVVNEREEFQGVSGQYRVYDIKVFNRETQTYEPIDLDKKYTIAAANYYLLEYGSGMTMFKDAEILKDDGILDVEALENYITNELNGRIGQEYANVQVNITFTE
jgi:2',3'-cyclic-nucleotide 2'-phosphodiesterase (5'-nucleotidase family)